MNQTNSSRNHRRNAMHAARTLMFVLIIALIHFQHDRLSRKDEGRLAFEPIDQQRLREFFPGADRLGDTAFRDGRAVLGSTGQLLGYVVQTSPRADHLVGFSGPTNALIAFSPEGIVVGTGVVSSGDTRDHVKQVVEDTRFMTAFNGLKWHEAAELYDVDAVSGATLTSLTIHESIILRLSGGRPSLKFPDSITVADAKQLFSNAHTVQEDIANASLCHVFDPQQAIVGSILRTARYADNIVGYQGPTDTLIGFNSSGHVIGIALGRSYDNEQYVGYVRDDEYFLTLFNDLVLEDLAGYEENVEGVSGATMTSMSVFDGMLIAAQRHHEEVIARAKSETASMFPWTWRDAGTALVIIGGLSIALTPLRGIKRVRIGFQLLVIIYLGLINGDMISQAMLIGWAQNSVPWSKAGGLVVLTAAAIAVPMTTRRNVYCTHLCPHGAAQQLLKNRLPWQLRMPKRLSRGLEIVPALLLLWCIVVAMGALPFSLVDIEPFDAWVFRVAGWATISIAVIGLVASACVPMAYCRYGCPTGAMLNFLRFNARSDRWSRRDSFAFALLALSIGMWLMAN